MTAPRVTEILNYFTNYDKVPSDILKNAAQRGTIVHGICAGIARGNWTPDVLINPLYLPYVESFRKWEEKVVLDYKIIEKRFLHSHLNFTGQMDFVITGHDGELYLIDLKTSASPQKTYALQMGAYDLLLENHDIKVKAAMVVYLSKVGDYPVVDYIEPLMKERHVFLSALDCYNYLHTRRSRGKEPEHLSKSPECNGRFGLSAEGNTESKQSIPVCEP